MQYLREFIHEATDRLEPMTRLLSARLALIVLLLAGLVSLSWAVTGAVHMLRVTQLVGGSKTLGSRSIPVSATDSSEYEDAQTDFVVRLPLVAPADLQIRFAAKLAGAQGVRITQMQSESIKVDSKAMGRSRITLQLRGDYRDIKNVCIALLAKYPGLVLEHLTLRHHADAPTMLSTQMSTTSSSPGDHADDEANIEMIQYTRPVVLTR